MKAGSTSSPLLGTGLRPRTSTSWRRGSARCRTVSAGGVCEEVRPAQDVGAKGARREQEVSKKGPFWLTLSKDRTTWMRRRKPRMRRVFVWCAEGMGCPPSQAVARGVSTGRDGQGVAAEQHPQVAPVASVLGELQPTSACARRRAASNHAEACRSTRRRLLPAIVSEADYYKAQHAMDGRRRVAAARRVSRTGSTGSSTKRSTACAWC